jgi:UDP-N-acetylglucosamine 4-epimerase
MYDHAFHQEDLSNFTFLVTGGAGFIGSHLVEYLFKHNAGEVRIYDNLSTGNKSNIEVFLKNHNISFIEADINDSNQLEEACRNVDYVLHQAALGSVPRSIEDPLSTHNSNATGFINLLEVCRKEKVKRIVYASSSSVYGDSKELPKKEDVLGNPKSPYAISKLVDEYYAKLYSNLHETDIVGLRYFNIFGPRQSPKGAYAAAIPLFILSAINGGMVKVFGDGSQTRDFTFVENAVQANIKALFSNDGLKGQVMNVACGDQFSLNEVLSIIEEITERELSIDYLPERPGDIMHSHASIEKAKTLINYIPSVDLKEGLKRSIDWYNSNK